MYVCLFIFRCILTVMLCGIWRLMGCSPEIKFCKCVHRIGRHVSNHSRKWLTVDLENLVMWADPHLEQKEAVDQKKSRSCPETCPGTRLLIALSGSSHKDRGSDRELCYLVIDYHTDDVILLGGSCGSACSLLPAGCPTTQGRRVTTLLTQRFTLTRAKTWAKLAFEE